MINFKYYPNLPTLPITLIPEVFETIKGKDLFFIKNDIYKIYDCTTILKNFLIQIFGTEYKFRVQTIFSDIKIHVDDKRSFAYNYLISTGGENVETIFHYEDNTILEKIVILPNVWHSLNVNVKHSVKNVESPRISLTVFIKEE